MTLNSFQFCPHCGKPYIQLGWPRSCTYCKTSHLQQTPLMVVPLLCVLLEGGKESVLAIEIENVQGPNIQEYSELQDREGESEWLSVFSKLDDSQSSWTLPSGLLNIQESIETASARIIKEQTGLDTDPFTFIPSFSRLSSGVPFLFCRGPNIPESLLRKANPSGSVKRVTAISEVSLFKNNLYAQTVQKFLNRHTHSMRLFGLSPFHAH